MSLLTALSCVLSVFAPGKATAESVDSELLLLVDVSNGGLKKGEFDGLMDGYAAALSSSQVVDAIAKGTTGKIAISLAYFGVDANQSVGLAWMEVDFRDPDAIDNLSDQIAELSEPSAGKFSYEDAMIQGLASFPSATGGGSGSPVQIIQVAGASKPKGDVSGVTALALSQGVELIGATLVGNKATSLENYYTANVVGSSVDGVTATVSTSLIDGNLEGVLGSQIGGAVVAVPEPSPIILLLSTMGVLLVFSRRRTA